MTGDEWGAELFEEGGIEEPSAADRERPEVEYRDASTMYTDHDTQAYLFLLAMAVERLGGAMAVTREQRAAFRFSLGIDQRGLVEGGDGVLRIYAIPDEAIPGQEA